MPKTSMILISGITSNRVDPLNTLDVAVTEDMITVKSSRGISKTGNITSLCSRFADIADIMFPSATTPKVPREIMINRANILGVVTEKNAKNTIITKSSRRYITIRFVSSFPKYIDAGDIGASKSPSCVPCSTSLL